MWSKFIVRPYYMISFVKSLSPKHLECCRYLSSECFVGLVRHACTRHTGPWDNLLYIALLGFNEFKVLNVLINNSKDRIFIGFASRSPVNWLNCSILKLFVSDRLDGSQELCLSVSVCICLSPCLLPVCLSLLLARYLNIYLTLGSTNTPYDFRTLLSAWG